MWSWVRAPRWVLQPSRWPRLRPGLPLLHSEPRWQVQSARGRPADTYPGGDCVWMHPCVQEHGHQRAAPGHSNLSPHGSASTIDVIDCASGARLAQPVERKALNLVVVGSIPTVGAAAETLAAAPSGPAVAALRASLARAARQGQASGHIPWGRLRLDAPLSPGTRALEGSARSQQLCRHMAQPQGLMSSTVHQEPA